MEWARAGIKNNPTRIYTIRCITEKSDGGGHVLKPYFEPPQDWAAVRQPFGLLRVCRDAWRIATHPQTGVFATGELVKVPVHGWRDYLVVRPNVEHFSFYSCRGRDDEVLVNLNRGLTTEDMFREVYHRLRRESPAYDDQVDRLLDTMKLSGKTFSRIFMLHCYNDYRPFPQLQNYRECSAPEGGGSCVKRRFSYAIGLSSGFTAEWSAALVVSTLTFPALTAGLTPTARLTRAAVAGTGLAVSSKCATAPLARRGESACGARCGRRGMSTSLG